MNAQSNSQTKKYSALLRRFTRKANYRLLPGACLLCGLNPSDHIDLCSSCINNLPRLGIHCPLCANPLNAAHICGRCLQKPPAFTQVRAPFLYQPPIDQLLHRFKFSGQLAAGKVLSQLLITHISRLVENGQCTLPDAIVPIPLHWKKRFSRGFNQSKEIAQAVSQYFKIPCHQHALTRITHTQSQRQLPYAKRQSNLKQAFALHKGKRLFSPTAGESLSGKRIVLIDDVLTTAATVNAASNTLLAGGVHSVEVWVLARTPLEN